ncbi:MAG: sporulation integral membrane protein YtvI [Lachnospiraceae bacterium]|nr:sporulation integral membrane protein YtvI [Lachnospiraceae bacterium]
MARLTRIFRYLLNILIPVCGWLLVIILGPKVLRFFMPFVIGWILAMIANPLVRYLEKHLKIVRKHSSVLIVVLVLAGLIGLIYLVCSKLIAESAGLIRDLPVLFETAKAEVLLAVGKLNHIFVRFPESVQSFIRDFGNNLGTYLSSLIQKIATPTVAVAGNVAKRIPALFVSFIITVLSSYFFIAERDKIMAEIKKWMPDWLCTYASYLRGDVKRLIGGYFLAQFKIMFVVALMLAAGFLVLGVDYGLAFALLIALLDFLPMFGTGTALGPWALVKLLSGEYAFAIGLILLYVLTQAVRQLIQPKIVGDTMGLPPLVTLFLLYLGFKVAGIAGMIIAVPVGLFVDSLYRHGAFRAIIENGRLLAAEVNAFRREENRDEEK